MPHCRNFFPGIDQFAIVANFHDLVFGLFFRYFALQFALYGLIDPPPEQIEGKHTVDSQERSPDQGPDQGSK